MFTFQHEYLRLCNQLTRTCCCASKAVNLAVMAAAATADAVGMAVGGIDGVTPTSGGVIACQNNVWKEISMDISTFK